MLAIQMIEDTSFLLTNNRFHIFNYITGFLYIIILLCFLVDLIISKFINLYIFMYCFIFIFLILLSFILHPDFLNEYVFLTRLIFTSIFPSFIIGLNVTDSEFIIKKSRNYIIFSLFYLILSSILKDNSIYYMTISYQVLPFCLLSYIYAIYSKKKIYFAIFALESLIILFLGARGAFLCVLVFVFISLMLNSNFRKKMKGISIILILISSCLVVFKKQIIDFSLILIPNSRFLTLLSEGNLFEISTRINIYSSLILNIISKPFLNFGLLSDRIFLIENYAGNNLLGFNVDTDMFRGLYAHNIFLELAMNFGVFIGIIISIYLIYILAIKFFILLKTNNKIQINFYILLFVIGFIPLMFSSSYLINSNFWILIGYSINKFSLSNRNNI